MGLKAAADGQCRTLPIACRLAFEGLSVLSLTPAFIHIDGNFDRGIIGFTGKRFRHLATASSRRAAAIQFAKSDFRSFETKRRSATRVPPIGLRIARVATTRCCFRFHCRNWRSIGARTIRRGAKPRANSTILQKERVYERTRKSVGTNEPRTRIQHFSLNRDEPIP
jgi:hypothetical protein